MHDDGIGMCSEISRYDLGQGTGIIAPAKQIHATTMFFAHILRAGLITRLSAAAQVLGEISISRKCNKTSDLPVRE